MHTPYADSFVVTGPQATADAVMAMAARPLRLGIMCTIGPLRFMPFLAKLRMDFPGLALTVSEGTPERLLARLAAGEIDLAVMGQPGPYAAQWRVHRLYREAFVIALPPGHRLAAGAAVPLAELHRERYVSRTSCEFADHIDRLLAAQGVELDVVFESEREEWVQMMIASGAGLACMPAHAPLLPGLATRPMVAPEVARDIVLVAPAGRPLPPAAATFATAIKAYDWAL
ncbi:MAG: LysR family transcriptional regulator substrate-binding protein [Rhodospirillaceae bacterium]|nr:LysR family transcriptional regulator substrate-binding protein [Rhodospirillaceae bacterium]